MPHSASLSPAYIVLSTNAESGNVKLFISESDLDENFQAVQIMNAEENGNEDSGNC